MKSKLYFKNIDIYSKKLGFFYKNKERIGSYFGLFLTMVYICASLILFIYQIIRTFQRSEMKVYDTTVYSKEMPSIDVDINKLYFAFALEHPKTTSRFIDESIYTAQVAYIDKRKVGDQLETYETKYLDFEPCNMDNFGEDYKNLFVKDELINSYCLKDFNYSLTFAGGYKYERMTYIRIRIYPCVNSTKNNNGCKSQEEIDFYLSSGYFSIVLKDFGLNPSNYSNPVLPTLQDLYTTIDKSLLKNYMLNFGVTEIHTDTGLINEKVKIERYLKFRKELENFTYREEKDYHEGRSLILAQLRLEDTVQIQTRKYTKISEIFSRIGGYMQLMNTVFLLVSSIITKIDSEIKIINSIFNFNVKEKKMIIKMPSFKEFNKEINLNALPNGCSTSKNIKYNKKQNDFDNKSKNNLILKEDNFNNISSLNNSENKRSNESQNYVIKIDKNKNIVSFGNCNRIPKSENFDEKEKKLNMKINKNIFDKSDIFNLWNKNLKDNNEYNEHINLNIFHYFCCAKNSKIYKNIELFNFGNAYFRQKLDIVRVFTILSIIEDFIKKKNN